MKKLFCLCLAAGMLLSVCACHKSESGSTQPPPAVSETTSADDAGQTADDTTPPEQATDQPASPSGS